MRRYVRTKRSRAPSEKTHILDGDKRIFDTTDKLTVFHKLYQNLHSIPEDECNLPPFAESIHQHIMPEPAIAEPAEISTTVSPSDIKLALSKTRNTAPGRDQIYYTYLKNLPFSTLRYLSDIYEIALKLQYFPTIWKIGHYSFEQTRQTQYPSRKLPPHHPASRLRKNFRPSTLISKIITYSPNSNQDSDTIIPFKTTY